MFNIFIFVKGLLLPLLGLVMLDIYKKSKKKKRKFLAPPSNQLPS